MQNLHKYMRYSYFTYQTPEGRVELRVLSASNYKSNVEFLVLIFVFVRHWCTDDAAAVRLVH